MWTEALAYIYEKVPKQVYETWFTPVELDRIENHTAYLAVPNKFFGDWLDEHYSELLAEAVSVVQGGEHNGRVMFGNQCHELRIGDNFFVRRFRAIVGRRTKNIHRSRKRRGRLYRFFKQDQGDVSARPPRRGERQQRLC